VSRLGIGLAAVARPAYITTGRERDFGAHRGVTDLSVRAAAVLDAAYQAGIRYLDVARSYGRAEEFSPPGWQLTRRSTTSPGDRDPKPVWLWTSAVGATPADVDRWWQAFLRGSDSRLNVRCQLRRFGLVRPGGRTPDHGVVSRRWWSSVVRAWISRVIWVFVFSSVSCSTSHGRLWPAERPPHGSGRS
jgi:hypothetical protein